MNVDKQRRARYDAKRVKNSPPPELLAHEGLYAARLADALTLMASEHAGERRLSGASVIAAFCWVAGRLVGANARDQDGNLEPSLDFIARQVRRAAVGEMARRSYTLQ